MSTAKVSGDASNGQIANSVNSLIRDVEGMQTTQIFKDDAGTRRVLLGRGANGFYGLKVSEDGIDVFDAADEDLVFNSNNNVFKIVSSGFINSPAVTIAAPGAGNFGTDTQYSANVSHGLGYAPIVLGFTADGGYYKPLPLAGSTAGSATSAFWQELFVVADATNVYVGYHIMTYGQAISAAAGFYRVKYYLLQESAS